MKGFYNRFGSKEGEFTFYYPSGKLQAQGNFKKNLRDGVWKYYFENGKPEREVTFTEGSFSPSVVYDTVGNKTMDGGTGMWRFEYEWYNEKEHYVITGKFENGKKTGPWICKLSNGTLIYRENYKDGIFRNGWINVPNGRNLDAPIDNKFMLPYKFEVTEKFLYTIDTERKHYPFLNFLPGKDPRKANQANAASKKDTLSAGSDEQVYYAVDEPAQFPGGQSELTKFLQTNIRYPAEAKRSGYYGKVFVKYIVEKDGSISNIEVIKGIHASLNEEAIRVISLFPKWVPGKQNDETVRSQFVLPIFFNLGR